MRAEPVSRPRLLPVLVVLIVHLMACTGQSEVTVDATATAWFTEEAGKRGIDFIHRSGFASRALLPEIVGGGAALVDVDGDGDLDVYLVQSGWNLDAGVQNDSPANQLYLNRGDGYFEISEELGDAGDQGYGMGVATGDYDNDGDVDLYVTNLGANVLLQNDGDGHFTNVAEAAGVDDSGWSTAAMFVDLDADGDLDLFVVNYLNWSTTVEKECFNRGRPTYCAPTAYDSPAMDHLFRNNGDGSFTDITAASGINRAFGNGLGLVSADFNSDGLMDIFVANDRLVDQLWINQGNLNFLDEAEAWGCAVDDNGLAKAGMGVAVADIDDDGDADLLVVNFEGESDSFYRNEGSYFVDTTARSGIAMATRKRTRFGVALADFDNDGYLDLYETTGKVDGDPAAVPDAFAESNMLFRGGFNPSGQAFLLEELMPSGGVPAMAKYTSRALAVGDVDGDGGLDLLVVNRDETAHLYINSVPDRGNWVLFKVLTPTGADALGASVSVRIGTKTRHQVVRTTASYLSAHDPRVHIGMGSTAMASDVKVRWIDGVTESFGDFNSGQIVELRRGNGISSQQPADP